MVQYRWSAGKWWSYGDAPPESKTPTVPVRIGLLTVDELWMRHEALPLGDSTAGNGGSTKPPMLRVTLRP